MDLTLETIILAMAGMDYSKVVEPDFDIKKLEQAPHVTKAIHKTSEIINEYFNKRYELREKAGRHGEIQERRKEIFYDTDNIFERQKEKIRICRDCAGALEIDSSASTGTHILAVHIPLNACPDCIQTGYDMFEKADPKKYDQIFLQDRPQNMFTIK